MTFAAKEWKGTEVKILNAKRRDLFRQFWSWDWSLFPQAGISEKRKTSFF